MDWTVRQVVAHIATTLLWYAVDLSAGPKELSTLELSVRRPRSRRTWWRP